MVREVDQRTFAAAHAAGDYVIDVREPFEYVAGHVPGARLIPLDRLPRHLAGLPAGEPIYVICASGGRSATAAEFLTQRGINARSVAGGIREWAASGRPVVRGAEENAA